MGEVIVWIVLGVLVFFCIRDVCKNIKNGSCGSCSGCGGACQGSCTACQGGKHMFKTTVGIDGMMCNMCESHVNEAIRKAFTVKKVSSSHKKNQAVIIAEHILHEDEIRKALEPTGYRVVSVQSEVYQKKGLFA